MKRRKLPSRLELEQQLRGIEYANEWRAIEIAELQLKVQSLEQEFGQAVVRREIAEKNLADLWASSECNTVVAATEHAKVVELQARVHVLEQTIRVSREKGIPPPLDRSER